jgi:hypothetical protein
MPHIALPDVHVDEPNRRIVMYYHGLNGLGQQITRAATSDDGIHFTARPEIPGLSLGSAIFEHSCMTDTHMRWRCPGSSTGRRTR